MIVKPNRLSNDTDTWAVSSSEVLHISFLTASAMLDGTTCSKSVKSRRLQTKNERIGRHAFFNHCQVATGTCERKQRQNKGSGQARTFFHTYIRYIIMDLIRIQQGVNNAACCSVTAILYHCDGHFISAQDFKLFADLSFRRWLPMCENHESLGPWKLELVRYSSTCYPDLYILSWSLHTILIMIFSPQYIHIRTAP